jgi:hypothetical protein
VSAEGGNINILSFHSLTGVGYKQAKSSNFASIAEYLSETELDFFCCDANEPKIDHPDISKIEFWNNGDRGKFPSLIFGENKVHQLEDSYRCQNNTPDRPAVSYITGKTNRRYDMIFNSKQWRVESLQYLYQESLEASSDHALVVGKFVRKNIQ